jgi:hypothetical protein
MPALMVLEDINVEVIEDPEEEVIMVENIEVKDGGIV